MLLPTQANDEPGWTELTHRPELILIALDGCYLVPTDENRLGKARP